VLQHGTSQEEEKGRRETQPKAKVCSPPPWGSLYIG
jgi:hypothetical protein